MEQLAGSNRAAGAAPGVCKRIYTFNPGGVGTNYLRRIFHLRQFHDNETPSDFMFIQGYGWDNYEWFRGANIVEETDFYHDRACAVRRGQDCSCTGNPEWDNDARFQAFITSTDFGRKLNSLPASQRLGELLGSFDKFAGQYYSDVWEPSVTVLPADMVARIIQPWWRRWLSSDWGFSHYAATGWFASGMLAPDQIAGYFGVHSDTPVRVIIQYRELVVNDVAEPDLARLVLSMTPPAERREIRDHWIGHDAWAKRGSANTVVEQMDPIYAAGGLPRFSRADIDRVGGWRLLYNGWASARRLRHWAGDVPFSEQAEDTPAFFISAACPEVADAVPLLICDEDNPLDVEKMSGQVSDDVADMIRYGLKSYLTAEPKAPDDVIRSATFSRYQDPTARAMAMLHLEAEQSKGQYIRRRGRA